MADRLEFAFIRTGKIAQVGTVSVDVNDPSDAKEISEKLKTENFAEFLVTDYEIEDHKWTFKPLMVEISNDE